MQLLYQQRASLRAVAMQHRRARCATTSWVWLNYFFLGSWSTAENLRCAQLGGTGPGMGGVGSTRSNQLFSLYCLLLSAVCCFHHLVAPPPLPPNPTHPPACRLHAAQRAASLSLLPLPPVLRLLGWVILSVSTTR